jgi:probable F420-dependent oxidoreductase
MDFGVTIFATDTTLPPVELARAAERLGFESLWLPEHSHIPVSRRTPWGGRENAPPLPEHYSRTFDTFVALSAAAAVTERLKLGTGITLLAQRDPIWTAKEVASLDTISGGRVLFGVGYGWNVEEMASHGVAYTDRRAMLREHVLTMKSLWTDEEASFEGEFVDLEPSWAWPKPVQSPHPPIILGATPGERTLADLVEYADGWIPLRRSQLVDGVEKVRRALEQAGRDPTRFDLSYFSAEPSEQAIEELRSAGFNRVILNLDSGPPDAVLRQMEDLAALARSLS